MNEKNKFRAQNIFWLVLCSIVCVIYLGREYHYWGLLPKTGNEILYEVGMGITNPAQIELSPTQFEEIKDLILKKPDEYNKSQKSLIMEKSGVDILIEVGMGKVNPKDLKISSNQFNEIKNLIESNPKEYNNVQKSLITSTIKN